VPTRRRPWSPRRNGLAGRRDRHNLEGRPRAYAGSTRSGQRPYGFSCEATHDRPGPKRHVCQCFHPSPTTRRSRQQDGVLRARSGLVAQLRRATRTGLCRRRRYEPPCCAADAATRSAQSPGRHSRRCGDVGTMPNLVEVGEKRCPSVARLGWARTSSEDRCPDHGSGIWPRLRGRCCGPVDVPCAIGHHRSVPQPLSLDAPIAIRVSGFDLAFS
jgi:hypothetical protein